MPYKTVTITEDQNKKALKDAYLQAVENLSTIQSTNLDTNNKLQQAVKAEAAIILKLLKFIKTRLVG